MSERNFANHREPLIQAYPGVIRFTWRLDEADLEVCLGFALNKKELTEKLSLIARLNGSHPTRVVELEDTYCPISASETIEVYSTPQKSDSPKSQMRYLARERKQPRRFFIQEAMIGFFASIHEHEEGPLIWERYDWIRGKLGIQLPNGNCREVDEISRTLVIPGGVKHQATGLSTESSLTLITTTARTHIHSDTF